MFHFARRVALGMDVGNLLHFQRALEGDREMDAAAEKEKFGRAEKAPRQVLEFLVFFEHGFELLRQRRQVPDASLRLRARERAAREAEIEREEVKRRKLRRKGFRRGHGDLRARVRVDGPFRLARHHAAEDVGNDQSFRALGLGLALAGDGVRRLARLRQEDRQGLRAHQRVAVAELRGVVHLHRHSR